jgi:hypothetical protein
MRWHTDWRFCYGLQSSLDVSVEGIFRKNGNIRQLKELSDEIDRNPSRVNLTTENPIQVAALLKKFLRDLPDPLLTSKLHKLFVTSQSKSIWTVIICTWYQSLTEHLQN